MTIKVITKKSIVLRNLQRRGYSAEEVEKILKNRKNGVVVLKNPQKGMTKPAHC